MINKFTIEEVKNFWDRMSSEYEVVNKEIGYVHTQRFEKAIEFGQIKPGLRILNVWSRTGKLIPYLRKVDNLEIYNREVSPKMIEIAKNKYPVEEFALTDLKNFSEFQNNYFDRIISLETLEHVPNPTAFLKEMSRILKPDGLLVMSLPPKGDELPEFIYKLFFKDHGEGPHNFPWPGQVKKMLRESGFALTAYNPFIILPFGSDKFIRLNEKILTAIFHKTPVANFGYRHFYVCQKSTSIV